ncbi:MAG TPA: LytTR family DNA-binding domain-containing protein [Longimicrobiaceae bacterium]|nr:LytTR family DNA-binding domain-containing protein [Longimicrobiaceae bacterium]
MSVRVVVVDDEPLARRRVLRLLREEGDGVEVAAVCSNGVEAVEAIRATRPDLVFLDVQMPEMDGFGVLEALGPDIPGVIFVTAYDQYALRAFEVHALDYLLKPFDVERFRRAFERGRTQLQRRASGQQRIVALLEQLAAERRELERRLPGAREPQHLEWVMVKVRGRLELVKTAELDWIEAEGNYVRLHAGKGSYLIREKISTLEERLDPEAFVRVHRSTIVNLNRVRELRPLPSGDYTVTLTDGTELKLSRGYRHRLAERVGEYG